MNDLNIAVHLNYIV